MDLRQWISSQELRDCLSYAVTNPEVIAVNQDPAGIGGGLLWQTGGNSTLNITGQLWGKKLQSGGWAVVALNRGNSNNLNITVNWQLLGWPSSMKALVRDIWQHRDLGIFSQSYQTPAIVRHGSVMLILQPVGSEVA